MTASQVTKPNPTRVATLAVVISSVLLGTAAVQADARVDPSPEERARAASQTDTAVPAAQEADSSADTRAETARTAVGSEKSNVDKDSSSGSYYPYSAGTVGDDPAEPTSTAVPADAGDDAQGPTDQWGDGADSDGDGYLSLAELTKAAPALAPHFDDMDVDGDKQLTRGEFRSWHESRKARMNSDQEASPTNPHPRSIDP